MGTPITDALLEHIDNYLKGNLSESEHIAFEKQIRENKELEETVRIQKQLFELHDFKTLEIPSENKNQKDITHYKTQLRTKENQDLYNKIREIGIEYTEANPKRKKNYLNYYIAASIALIFGTFLLLNTQTSLNTYYKENVNWEELPSFIDKGKSDTFFTQGERLFKNKEYTKAIASFKKIEAEEELYPYSLLYIGASYDQLNQNEKALEAFDTLSQITTFQEKSKAYWYKMLLYLKQNNQEKALEMKNLITKDRNNYKYQETLQLKF